MRVSCPFHQAPFVHPHDDTPQSLHDSRFTRTALVEPMRYCAEPLAPTELVNWTHTASFHFELLAARMRNHSRYGLHA